MSEELASGKLLLDFPADAVARLRSTTPRSATRSTTTSSTRSRRRFPAWTGGSMCGA